MKIVLDTNVLIAAFASRGLCIAIFELCADRYDIVVSEFIFSEISDFLLNKFKVPHHTISSIIEYLENSSIVLEYTPLQESLCRDKTDDEILALAERACADYIITGDKDLLVLKKYKHTEIVGPRDFWELAKQENRQE